MATNKDCKKCKHREGCPILYAIKAEHIKADETFRKKCISYTRE